MNLDNNRYLLSGDVDPLALVEKYGTPLYVYDTAIIERQYKRMTTAFDVPRLKINYACKANTNLNIMRFLAEHGAGLDAVSPQEIEIGLQAGFKAEDIIFTPSCANLDDIKSGIEKGVRVNIDSISLLEQFGHEFPDVPVGIRINPHIMAGGNSKISTGHIDSKFGISIHQLPHVLKVVEATGLRIEGLHMHSGSDIYDATSFLLGADVLLNTASNFPHLEYIDLGSGFKVPYKEDDIETDIEEVGERISERFRNFCSEFGRDLTLIFRTGQIPRQSSGQFFRQSKRGETDPKYCFSWRGQWVESPHPPHVLWLLSPHRECEPSNRQTSNLYRSGIHL